MPSIDPTLVLSAAFLVFATVTLVAAVRRFVPTVDGPVLVAVCCLAVGTGASFLAGGGTWRGLLVRGLLAGAGAFGAANAWQWSKSKAPSPINLAVTATERTAPTEPPLNPPGESVGG